MSSTKVKTYRKKQRKIIMHSNWILDSVANLFVRHMVFVENAQKSPIASHPKGFDPSLVDLDFWYIMIEFTNAKVP